jgi:hypothetical protein
MQRKIIRVPRFYKTKFLGALADTYMSSITDSEKIAYANRAMRNEFILNKDLYEHNGIRQELTNNIPSLVSEWDNVVKNHGVNV